MKNQNYEFDILYELDSSCVMLYDVFTEKIFGTEIENFQKKKPSLPQFIYDAGFTPESGLTATQFEDIVLDFITANKVFSKKEIYQSIYERDVHFLISCLQGRFLELREHFRIYWHEINTLSPFEASHFTDTVFFQSGEITALLFSQINSLIIKAASILDLVSKIHCEYMSELPEFSKIAKLRSNKVLFRGYKKFNIDAVQNRVFNIIFSLRHELVHNGSIDNNHIYFETKDGKVIKRWIPVQDFSQAGYLNKSNNRRSFFAQGNEFNRFAPIGIHILLKWLLKTIKDLT